MDLFDILACPVCRVPVQRSADTLVCNACDTEYPIIDSVPVMLPGGKDPDVVREVDLQVRETYDPWVHRVVLQSLLDNQIVVDIGAGNMALDDPCIIRMDVVKSPFVDLVADAHYMPFLPGSLDFVFSLAVIEHLGNPFLAANSIYEVLKDGGYIYHECNFVFAYHGWPHHYFNASLQGLEMIFSKFVPLRKGVAPYQMPSFALRMVLSSYLKHSRARAYKHGRELVKKVEEILDSNLMEYDIYFNEEDALNVAAGTYFAGLKQEGASSSIIPSVLLERWGSDQGLQDRFPNVLDLTTIENILIWAKSEGCKSAEIADSITGGPHFNKKGADAGWDRSSIKAMPLIEPKFKAIGFDPDLSVSTHAKRLLEENWSGRAGVASESSSGKIQGSKMKSIVKRLKNVIRRRYKRIGE